MSTRPPCNPVTVTKKSSVINYHFFVAMVTSTCVRERVLTRFRRVSDEFFIFFFLACSSKSIVLINPVVL